MRYPPTALANLAGLVGGQPAPVLGVPGQGIDVPPLGLRTGAELVDPGIVQQPGGPEAVQELVHGGMWHRQRLPAASEAGQSGVILRALRWNSRQPGTPHMSPAAGRVRPAARTGWIALRPPLRRPAIHLEGFARNLIVGLDLIPCSPPCNPSANRIPRAGPARDRSSDIADHLTETRPGSVVMPHRSSVSHLCRGPVA
jgi:hypothetical protein